MLNRVTFVTASLACASPAAAAPFYFAQPAAAPASGRQVIRDTLWRCAGSVCAASRTSSRPEIVCQAAARHLGRLASFTAGEAAFDPTRLEKCNAAAE